MYTDGSHGVILFAIHLLVIYCTVIHNCVIICQISNNHFQIVSISNRYYPKIDPFTLSHRK